MIRCKLKKSVGFHLRREPGKGMVRYNSGDIMKVENISELGGAADKFEILDPVPEKDSLELDEAPVLLEMAHRGGGRYNVVNKETGETLNEDFLTKEEAQRMVDATEIEVVDKKDNPIDVDSKREGQSQLKRIKDA